MYLFICLQVCAQFYAPATGIMRTASAAVFRAGRAWSASCGTISARWLIVVDTANVLMGNVFVPEDTLDQHASKVRKTITRR